MTAIRAEKLKWDGTVSTVDEAHLVDAPAEAVAWYVAAGSVRSRPGTGEAHPVANHELWVAVPGQWWVLCGKGDDAGRITGFVLHAASPFESPDRGVLRWIDLDLDFEVSGDDVHLEDEAQFHAHARSMSYPDDVVRGAWSGISQVAPRYTTGDWPFDGWMEHTLADAVG